MCATLLNCACNEMQNFKRELPIPNYQLDSTVSVIKYWCYDVFWIVTHFPFIDGGW